MKGFRADHGAVDTRERRIEDGTPLCRETRRAVRSGAGCGRQNRRLQAVTRNPETRANWEHRRILAQSR